MKKNIYFELTLTFFTIHKYIAYCKIIKWMTLKNGIGKKTILYL